MSSSSINTFQYLFAQRNAPEYANEPLVNIQFADEMKFEVWYANVAIRHINWIKRQIYVNKRNAAATSHILKEALIACLLPKETRYFICNHEGLPFGEASESNESIALQKSLEPFFNGTVTAEYEWQHASHDTLATLELASSRLINAIKNWIHQQVGSNKDWKANKVTLRLSEQHLDTRTFNMTCQKRFQEFLLAYLKSPKDMVNIRLWMEEMRENKLHSILFSVDSDTNDVVVKLLYGLKETTV
ncbi:hypothetical protein G6F46_009196 [Rhizopus delemar]|nr:hypothetical protein G6F55_008184 [Rhizopus delemar]KAG1548753.1 hypothetical protein G6F49_009804 [Rhizopus delemar]KAG1611513.1 hypothetical protein G6F46_009196 [Rhizopus delemar]